MFTIRLKTQQWRPNALVTLRAADAWLTDRPGLYADDAWTFVLDEADFPGGIEFKFVLERTAWMNGANLAVQPQAGGVYEFDGAGLTFPANEELVVDNSFLQRLLFPTRFDEDHVYDVVIVGSGMGGGILADQLSDQGAEVLVLEAGSYLFPTHVGNLPRKHNVGRFDKHLWNLYEDFKVSNYAPGGEFKGGQAFSLGGRSVFWGGLIPRMTWWELELWPQAVRWYLESAGYERAEALMNRSALPSSPYRDGVRRFLREQLPDFEHVDAPVAVDYRTPASGLLSGGVFSTADLMTESQLTPGAAGNQNLWINLNHVAVQLLTAQDAVTGVVALDLVANRQRTFRGRRYVLAGGTIESAKLAKMSQLADPNALIGAGITDHPIFYVHFTIPAGTAQYSASDASKTLSQHRQAAQDAHPYNLVIELGADLNQGRYVDDDVFAAHQAGKGQNMLCELVFLLNSGLLDANRLDHQGPAFVKPQLAMARAGVSQALRAEMQDHAVRVIGALGGQPLDTPGIVLTEADLGGVAHEVGTLRLAGDATGVVDANLRFEAYENLYACDNSVFPSSPAANPSLTLAALAIRLADDLAARA